MHAAKPQELVFSSTDVQGGKKKKKLDPCQTNCLPPVVQCPVFHFFFFLPREVQEALEERPCGAGAVAASGPFAST